MVIYITMITIDCKWSYTHTIYTYNLSTGMALENDINWAISDTCYHPHRAFQIFFDNIESSLGIADFFQALFKERGLWLRITRRK